MGELYKLVFPNGKKYIGISERSAVHRFRAHAEAARSARSTTALYRAWRKHGQPILSVLAVIEKCHLYETEIGAIRSYGTLVPHGYNVSYGGDIPPMKNPMVAAKTTGENNSSKRPEVRAKISASVRALGDSHPMKRPESRARVSAFMTGRRPTLLHKEAQQAGFARLRTQGWISKNRGRARPDLRGDNHPSKRPEARARVSARFNGVPFTEEHKARISASLTGDRNPMKRPDVRAKVSASQKGIKKKPRT